MVLEGAGPWKTSFMLTCCVMPSRSEADRRGAHRWATHRRKAVRAGDRRSPGETRAIAFEHIMSRAVESATGKPDMESEKGRLRGVCLTACSLTQLFLPVSLFW